MKRFLQAGVAAGTLAAGVAATFLVSNASATELTVYKSPYCGCCAAWVDHMEANGFEVEVKDVENLEPIKRSHGLTRELASCHTAVVEGYVIEGHVPAADVRRLLAEKPAVKGLAVPGMPMGSPGMEGPTSQPYEVVSFDRDGNVRVVNRY